MSGEYATGAGELNSAPRAYRGLTRGTLYLCGRPTGLGGVGVHHFLLLVTCTETFVVYEWAANKNSANCGHWHAFSCEQLGAGTVLCRKLGNHTKDEVFAALQRESHGQSYALNAGNCNSWCQRVAARLGHAETNPTWNCTCGGGPARACTWDPTA